MTETPPCITLLKLHAPKSLSETVGTKTDHYHLQEGEFTAGLLDYINLVLAVCT